MTDDFLLLSLLASGLNQCRVAVVDNGGLIAALFLAGLVGGPTHCVGMCGPFVLSQVGARLEALPAERMREFHRLTGAALIPYHLGRTVTYAALGAAAALVTGGAASFGGLRWLSAALLAGAALFFIAYGLSKFRPALARWMPGRETRAETWWSRSVGRLAKPLFASPMGWRGFLLGVALGFIPCGLLYGALAAAASSGSTLGGAFAMAAFAAGTVPALVAVGVAGHMAGRRWRGLAAQIAPALLILNGAVLSVLAWRVMA